MFVFFKKYELFLIWIRNLKYKKHFPNILKIFTTTTTKKDNVKLKWVTIFINMQQIL